MGGSAEVLHVQDPVHERCGAVKVEDTGLANEVLVFDDQIREASYLKAVDVLVLDEKSANFCQALGLWVPHELGDVSIVVHKVEFIPAACAKAEAGF